MIFATGLQRCKKKVLNIDSTLYFYSFLTYSEHIRKCSKLQIMIVFPVLIPVQNFLFPGTGRENLKCHGKGRDGKFEACIPGNHGKREFPLTPAPMSAIPVFYSGWGKNMIKTVQIERKAWGTSIYFTLMVKWDIFGYRSSQQILWFRNKWLLLKFIEPSKLHQKLSVWCQSDGLELHCVSC